MLHRLSLQHWKPIHLDSCSEFASYDERKRLLERGDREELNLKLVGRGNYLMFLRYVHLFSLWNWPFTLEPKNLNWCRVLFSISDGCFMIQFHPKLIFMDWFSTVQISSDGSHSVPTQHPQSAVCPLENAKLLHIFCQNSKYPKSFSLIFFLIFLIKKVGEGTFEPVTYFNTKARKRISAYWLVRYY